MADINKIQNCINEIPSLIQEVEAMQPMTPAVVHGYITDQRYSAGDIIRIKERVSVWKAATTEVIISELGESNPYLFNFSSHWRAPMRGISFKEGLKHKLQRASIDLNILVAAAKERQEKVAVVAKNSKVFISHKTEDRAYADAIIHLINFIIGADGDKVFCSSIAGYGVKPSQDIIDKIKEQFTNHNLFVVIIHSPRYYKSPVCLNEMGAAWALDTKFYSFLTKDCRIDQLTGVIGNEEMCISPNADEEMLNAHLNSFKEDLVSFFGASPIDQSKWEHERKQFVEAIAAIKDAETPGETNDLFDTVYLPTFDAIFDILDADHFHDWAYLCALDGNTILTKRASDAINRVIAYVRSRPKHKEYASWDSLIQNLGLLLSDFKTVFACHSDNMGPDAYTVERFYKYGPMGQSYNPNYDVDLNAYNEHVFLISDLLFELARLGNLILSRIRAIHPEYKRDLGILYIDDRVNTPDLVYREEEISDSPYPGIKDFISVRLSREKHYGTSGTIDEDGYEKEYKKSLFENN